jgi:hypothetical protein
MNTARDLPQPVHSAIHAAIPRGINGAVSARKKRIALGVAAISDIAQWAFFPVTVEGGLSPVEIAIDAATAFIILLIVGFQWRLAFALVAELVPGLDLFPTWTAVVLSMPSVPDQPPQPQLPQQWR